MQETLDQGVGPRRPIARIGICLLNLWQPGLGLVRLAHYRAGIALIALTFATLAIVLAVYAFGPELTYEGYLALLAFALSAYLALYGVGIFLSWRRSGTVLPRRRWLWHWYGVLGLGAAATGILLLLPEFRSYYGSFYSASQSMAPTLEEGDRVLADMNNPEPLTRGEVVIERTGGYDYVRRIAAIPGDTIAMRNAVVFLNGKPVTQQPVGEESRSGDPLRRSAKRLREQFPGEESPHLIYDFGPTPQDHMQELTLGDDEYFLLGDNRDNSLDSRFGPEMRGPGIVTSDRIVGRVLFRYWRKGVGLENGEL